MKTAAEICKIREEQEYETAIGHIINNLTYSEEYTIAEYVVDYEDYTYSLVRDYRYIPLALNEKYINHLIQLGFKVEKIKIEVIYDRIVFHTYKEIKIFGFVLVKSRTSNNRFTLEKIVKQIDAFKFTACCKEK